MYCDKCNADGGPAKEGQTHGRNEKGELCGGKFTLKTPATAVKPKLQVAPGRGRVIAGTTAAPEKVASLALASARSGTSGGLKATADKGQPVADVKVNTTAVKPQPKPTVTEEPVPQKDETASPDAQFRTELESYRAVRAKARLDGADAELLEKLSRLDAALATVKPGDDLEKPRKVLALAQKFLAEALATVPQPKVDPALAAFESVREAAEQVMREVEAVTQWPKELMPTREKLQQVKLAYDQQVADAQHAAAAKLAQTFTQHGSKLLASKKTADEAGFKAFGEAWNAIAPAVKEAHQLRQQPDCPVDDDTAARFETARTEAVRARNDTRWDDGQRWLTTLGTVADEIRNAGRAQSEFQTANDAYRQLKSGGVLEGAPDALLDRLETTDAAVDEAVAAKAWARATEQVGLAHEALEDAIAGAAEWRDYQAAATGLAALREQGDAVRSADPCPADDATARRWDAALQAHDDAVTGQRWREARDGLAEIEEVAGLLTQAQRDEAAFRTVHDELVDLKAGASLEGAQSTLLDQLSTAETAVDEAIAAKAWSRATQQARLARSALDQAIASAAEWRDYQAAATELPTWRTKGDAVRSSVPCPADDGTARRWDVAVRAHDNAVAASQWSQARGKLAEIERLALQLQDADTAKKEFDRQELEIATVVAEAAEFETHAQLRGSAANWQAARRTVTEHKDARDWAAATTGLAQLRTTSETLATRGKALKARDECSAAFAAATDLNALLALTNRSGSQDSDYDAAREAYTEYIAKFNDGHYVEAKAQVLLGNRLSRTVLDQIAAYNSYQTVASGADQQATVDALAAAQANKASDASQDPFYDARSAWVAEHNAGRWAQATAAFRNLVTASRLVLDDAAFRAVYDVKATQDTISSADKAANYPPPADTPAETSYNTFRIARDRLDQNVKEKKFVQAKNGVAALKTAASQLLTALDGGTNDDKKAFEDASKLTDPKVLAAEQAKAAAGTTIPALVPVWRELEQAQAAVTKAKDGQKWVRAHAALIAVDQAAVRLTTLHTEGVAFELQYTEARRKAVADARAVVAEGLPHLAAEGQAFSDLHRQVTSLIAAGRYAEAGLQLAELDRLAKVLTDRNALLGAKDSPSGQRIRELLAQAQALKARVVEPARDLDPAAVTAVSTLADECIGLLAGATPGVDPAALKLADANTRFSSAELARETAWKDYWKVAGKQITDARAAGGDLDANLKALREKAIDAGTAAIDKAVSKKHYGSATAKAKQLLDEAETWMQAGAAYAALDPAVPVLPDVELLKELVERKGGGKVLDEMVAARMAVGSGISAKRLNVAMEARFGFKAQRYDRRNASGSAAEEEGNVTEKPATFADKSILQTYLVMAKVPQQHWSAKLDAMIVYDKNEDEKLLGGHFSRRGDKRKVYMYCGRPEDDNKQTFGSGQKILPEGEEVEDSCKPVDESPAPLFDFTLLHEAGHAEDDARGYMSAHAGQADHGGWKVHAGPQDFAGEVARHFGYDEAYILATLRSPSSTPPREPATLPTGGDAAKWERARQDAVAWCRSVREAAQPWENATLSRATAIQGRVYQEASAGRWVSYDLAARARGISSYQFRSPAEWFAELYAAYFSKKLKDNHPSAKWLKTFKGATARA